MAIGRELACVSPESSRVKEGSWMRPLRRAYYHLYGTSDLHTHTRWRAVRTLVSPGFTADDAVVLEVGCGAGVMSFEVARMHPRLRIVGIDADARAIELAEEARIRNALLNTEFRVLRVPGLEVFAHETFDVVLLIDVIEHVNEDVLLMQEIHRVLKPGGRVLISVPTPNYPRVFGRKFHQLIGHVRDGYWQSDLEALLRATGFRAVSCKAYTYPPSVLACFAFYRGLMKIHFAACALSPLLDALSRFDAVWPLRRERFACSIALKAIKQA